MAYDPPSLVAEGSAVIEDIEKESYFDHMRPCCDLDLEDSKLFFPHDTLAHDAASPYQVW